VAANIIPPSMHLARGIENADLTYRGVHADQVAMVYAVVGSERMPNGVLASLSVNLRICFLCVRPQLFRANAVFVPAFHGTACAGAFVFFARPFIVALRH